VQFGADALAVDCVTFARAHISTEHVCHMLCMGRLYGQAEVVQQCLDFIDAHPECVTEGDGVLELSSELLALLIRRDAFRPPGGEVSPVPSLLRDASVMCRGAGAGCHLRDDRALGLGAAGLHRISTRFRGFYLTVGVRCSGQSEARACGWRSWRPRCWSMSGPCRGHFPPLRVGRTYGHLRPSRSAGGGTEGDIREDKEYGEPARHRFGLMPFDYLTDKIIPAGLVPSARLLAIVAKVARPCACAERT
jgi:hypothetical protein